MSGKDLFDVEFLDLVERLEKIAQEINSEVAIGRDVGGDAREKVIACEKSSAVFIEKTEMSGRVARCVDGPKGPARHFDDLVVFDEAIGLWGTSTGTVECSRHHERLRFVRRCAQTHQPLQRRLVR